jgi:hypothetical protein
VARRRLGAARFDRRQASRQDEDTEQQART